MNTENVDLAAADRNSPESTRKRRGWFRRHWFWSMLLVLLVLAAIGAGWGYWWYFGRVFNADLYQTAMERIGRNEVLQRELGRPIRIVGWPPPFARLDAFDKEILWNVQGPQGRAKARALAQVRAGQWATIVMEVTLPDGQKVSLIEESDDAGDAPPFQEAPPFQGTQPPSTPPETNAPGPNINLPMPDVQVPDGE